MATSAADVATRFGDAYLTSTGWWRCTCPVHEGVGSLGVRDGDDGLIVHCFAGCPPADIMEKVGDIEFVPAPKKGYDPEAKWRRVYLARDIWRTSTRARETSLVGIYLATRQILQPVPRSLRLQGMFGPYGEHKPSGAHRPQMVAPIQHTEREGIIGVHRTFLCVDGYGKADLDPPRLMNGLSRGGAVRLAPLGPVLIVAEGIETTLSGMEALRLPGWAALSAGGLEALVLPREVREVIILADHDKAGQEAADKAACRFVRECRRARVAIPESQGADFNDVLKVPDE